VYERDTLPVAGHYDRLNRLAHVDGTGSIDEIFSRICGQVDNRMSN
jgi:adenylate kinase family enzyme